MGRLSQSLVPERYPDQRLQRGKQNVEVVDRRYLIPSGLGQIRLSIHDLDGRNEAQVFRRTREGGGDGNQ